MATETRTVRMAITPRLAAYLAWLDRRPGRTFDLAQYDLFCANYRESIGEDDGPTEEMITRAIRIPLERPR